MTSRRYRRLFLVLVLPLLLAGVLFAHFVAQYGEGPFVTCEPVSDEYENCRNVGWEGNLHDNVIASHPAWFDIQLTDDESDGPFYPAIQGSRRAFDDAKIISASAFALQPPEVANLMGSLAGQNAGIILGIAEGQMSHFDDKRLLLYCNSLWFQDRDGEYQAQCFGDGWGGQVNFTLGEEGARRADLLHRFAKQEIDSNFADYRIYQIVMYPLFIYLFLVGSGLVWLSLKAYRFVKAG